MEGTIDRTSWQGIIPPHHNGCKDSREESNAENGRGQGEVEKLSSPNHPTSGPPERSKVKVTIEWGDIKHTVEGDLEVVVREVMQFAARVLPNYSLASKLTFNPDYSTMVDDLSEVVKLTPEGEVVMLRLDMSAENSILLVLLAVRVANAVGSRPTVDMAPEVISKSIGRAVKTVRNTLATMTKTGAIDRTNDGGYKLTMQGIRRAHEVARSLTTKPSLPRAESSGREVQTSG
jgi:hypothetical protein